MNKTGIQYLDYTWNPTKGCTPISAGCANCWARHMAYGRLKGKPGYPADDPFCVHVFLNRLTQPQRIKNPSVVGVSFMGDLFHKDVPHGFITKVFASMANAPWHTFKILTKRPSRALEWFNSGNKHLEMTNGVLRILQIIQPVGPWPLPNVHIGVSVENQATADERIPLLLQIPAAVRWVSVEPLLSPLDLDEVTDSWWHSDGINQFVVGCESGPSRRPMQLKWARDLRDQCKAAGTAFYMKQIEVDGRVTGDMSKFPEDLRIREVV